MFNKETEYAIKGLVYIQQQNYQSLRPSIIEISDNAGVPKSYIAKILQRLVRSGLLCSLKGKNGGFYFDAQKPDLVLKELMVQTQSVVINECVFGLKECDCENPCPLHDKYKEIKELTEDLITTESIQSLAKK